MVTTLSRRRIEPELLDHLPVDDPKAIGSRRDLARINMLMFQARIMTHLYRKHVRSGPLRILEIGAGDGSFMLKVARLLGSERGGTDLTLLDQADLLPDSRRADFAKRNWRIESVTADLSTWLQRSPERTFDVVSANLFLHHFADEALREIFAVLADRAPVFLATEPRRNGFALYCSSLLWAIGANSVTMHDAAASVRGGFTASELSPLWPRDTRQQVEERTIGPFTHCFVAAAPAGADR